MQELVDFVADHPRILMRALGVCIGPKDLFRVAVQLGPNCVDFCTANFQPSMGRLSEYHFVLLGPVDVPVFASDQRGTAFNAAVNRATDIGDWLQSNLAEARKLLPNVPTTVLTKVVAGRRPQPGSPATKALQDLNDDLIRIQIRTYDWLLDSALAFAEGGDQ